jgi:hypothetical protein
MVVRLACLAAAVPLGCTAGGRPPHEDAAGPVIAGLRCPAAPLPAQRAADGTPLPREIGLAASSEVPALTAAQAAGDEAGVFAAVCRIRAALGAWQGVAEAAAPYRDAPSTPVDAAILLPGYLATIESDLLGREPWARAGESLDGAALSEPLRASCEIVAAYAAVGPLAGSTRAALATAARRGADWLVRVQRPDGAFPFPDLTDDAMRFMTDCRAAGQSEAACRDRLPRAFELAVKGKQAWEAAGRPPGVLVDGWFVSDEDGGLQFDTGTCGVALLAAAGAFAEPRYLQAARAAAGWAEREEIVSNWNYNAFSVELMARLAAVEAERGDPGAAERWRRAGLRRARLGVLPGALSDGRWYDPHNARIVYHHIILRALAALELVADDPWLTVTLEAAWRRSVEEIELRGAAGWSDGLEAYLTVSQTGREPGAALWRLIHAAAPGGKPATLQLAAWISASLAPR